MPPVRVPGAVVALIVVAASACSAPTGSGSVGGDPHSSAAVDAAEPTATPTAQDEALGPPAAGLDAEEAATDLVWIGCGIDLECADLTVPVDRSDRGGATIDLAVVRRPATSGAARGTIVLNPGGPGGSGVEWLSRSSPVPADVAAVFDLVSWDPRGVGSSAPLGCDAALLEFYELDSSPDDQAERTGLESAAEQAATECVETGEQLLAHIGVDDNVADIEALRVALGDEPLRYVGFSYGTFLGLGYLREYADRVGAMVLDGVVDPALTRDEFLREQTIAFDVLLDRVLATCANQSPCPVANDLATLVDDLVASSETTPLPIAGGETLGPAAVVDALLVSLYSPSGHGRLIDALGRWAVGDAGGIAALADAYLSFGGWDAYTAVSCVDAAGATDPAAARALADDLGALSPRLGEAVANELLPCAYWPIRAATVEPTVPNEGVPIVLIGGRTDPATPLAWAESVRDQLGAARLIVFEGDGHTAIGRSACVDDAVVAYLVAEQLPDDNLTCLS